VTEAPKFGPAAHMFAFETAHVVFLLAAQSAHYGGGAFVLSSLIAVALKGRPACRILKRLGACNQAGR
jgi:hypothetical protein